MESDRKKELLHHIILTHIETGAPVGSVALAKKGENSLSPATIRNEMADLEEKGYITHPHTSAGRIPTAKGWRFYIDNILAVKEPSRTEQQTLHQVCREKKLGNEDTVKSIARTLADMSKNASIVGFSADNVYYTGLSNLFAEPEFENVDVIRRMSEIIDHLDDVMRSLFKELKPGVHILVGEENPFGTECGVVLSKQETKEATRLYGILGPARMHYDRNLGYIQFTNSLFIQ